ncbi:hypothetical protein GCM10025734_80050 [Kitasatospora paranensis]|uniref:hypothetical protein n=1 Tax=Kitasatospora paranensis TaxID=258053 RepID=UPI0031E6E083
MTARVAHLTDAQAGSTQLTFDRTTEDRRTLEPVIDRANLRWGTGTLRPAVLTAPAAVRTGSAGGPGRGTNHRPAGRADRVDPADARPGRPPLSEVPARL